MTLPSMPKLWPESFRLLRASSRGWAPYVLFFTLLLVPADAWEIKEAGPYNQKVDAVYQDFFNALGGDQDPMTAYTAAQDKINTIPGPDPLVDIVPPVLSIVALYFLYVRLLAASSALAAPKMNLRGFGAMLLKLIEKYAIVIVPPVILGSLGGAITMALASSMGMLLGLIFLSAAVFVGGYFFCSYTVALPLAVSGIKAALKQSGVLATGNIWRLAGGYAVITTVLLPPMLVVPVVPMLPETPGMAGLLGLAVLMAASQMTVALVFAAFGCAAFTILYSEKQAAEPSFKLLSST